jgi:transcriptional regulator with XRE-family HTH domain
VDEKSPDDGTWDAFGTYLRTQRHLAQLSLRQLADLTNVSNPYLSQIERGLHQPSIAIVKALAEALDLSVSDLLAHDSHPQRPAAQRDAEERTARGVPIHGRSRSRLRDCRSLPD